jgi:sugar phosphate isomerase/epimerase
MSNRILSLAAGTMLDVGPADAISVAADAGWPAVGIWFDPQEWDDATARQVNARLASTGSIALDIEPIILAPEGPLVTDAAARLIDAGIAVGARNVLVASRDPDPARVAASLAQFCDRARGTDIRIVLEFLPIMAVRTLGDAVSIVEQVDEPAAGVLIDMLHLVRSGGAIADVGAVDPALLPYAQLCDVMAIAPGDIKGLLDEALHGRLLPGEGVAPIAELLCELPAGCPVSLEMRSRRLMADFPDPTARAAAVLEATLRVGSVQRRS